MRTPKCQICKQKSKELTEVTTDKGIIWACKQCAPIKYKKAFIYNENVKKVKKKRYERA